MSLQARRALVDSPNTVFAADSQRADLLDGAKTQTELVALLLDLCVHKGWILGITAVRTDHHDDRGLGDHCHARGYAADLWPMKSTVVGDWLDAGDARFARFLADLRSSHWLYQIGLVGDGADSAANFAAAGPTAFQDDGGAHVHCAAQ